MLKRLTFFYANLRELTRMDFISERGVHAASRTSLNGAPDKAPLPRFTMHIEAA